MCERIPIPGGGYAIACTRGSHRRRKCATCGTRTASRLCDGITATGPCDKPLCDLCAHARGQGDYCDDCLPKRPRLAL